MVDKIIELADSLKNWGKWGKDDEKGCLNYITEEQTVEAGKLIKKGVNVSCARPIKFFSKDSDVDFQASRFMLETGIGRENEGNDCDSHNFERRPIKENISLVFHGYSITHMDSFAHFFWKGKMYNGYDSNRVNSLQGAQIGSIEPLKNGIFGCGVLLDIPRAKKVDWMEPGTAVSPQDLEDAVKSQNLQISAGDVLLVRTGYYKMRLQNTSHNPREGGTPALHPLCMSWISEKKFSLLGTDTNNDVIPPLFPEMAHPVHVLALCLMGLYLIDNMDLEALALECDRQQRWRFAFSVNPLQLQGVTGSPVNPIALF